MLEMDRKYITKLVASELVKQADKVANLVIDAVIAHLTEGLRAQAEPATKKRRAVRTARPKVSCIAGCGKQSLGPRWSYLCKDHKDAPKKDIAKWKEARRKKQDKIASKGALLKKFQGKAPFSHAAN